MCDTDTAVHARTDTDNLQDRCISTCDTDTEHMQTSPNIELQDQNVHTCKDPQVTSHLPVSSDDCSSISAQGGPQGDVVFDRSSHTTANFENVSHDFDSTGAQIELHTVPISGQISRKINPNAKPVRGLYVEAAFRLENDTKPFHILLDSGAEASLLSDSTFERLPDEMKPDLKPTFHKVKVADGRIQPCSGIATIPLRVGDTIHPIQFLVGNFADEAILGMSELHLFGFKVDYETYTVTKDDLWIPVYDANCNAVSKQVVVRKSVTLAPRSETVVSATVFSGVEGNFMSTGLRPAFLEPARSFVWDHCVMPAKSLHDIDNGDLPILLCNPTSKSVFIKPNTIVGRLVDVEDVSEPFDVEEEVTDVRNVAVHSDGTPLLKDIPAHLTALYENSAVHLNEDQKVHLRTFLIDYADVFSEGDFDIGRTPLVKHKIVTKDAIPVKQAPRKQHPAARAAADEIVDDLLKRNLIRKSDSPWSSPIVMCKKKDGSYRLCIDYRATNAVTVKDAYPLPRIDETLDSLSNAKWFSSTDLASGYWQVEMDEDSKSKTAFCTKKGLFEWNVMPFGLSNACATFQRLMESVLSEMRFTACLVYIDDVVLHGSSFTEMLNRLIQFAECMRRAQLKLKPKKCFLFQKSITFLGHVVDENGKRTDPKKVEAVKNWPTPTNKKGLRSFLGLCSYYRQYIKDFANVAKPLSALTSVNAVFQWSDECQNAFNTLKEKMVSSPILGYPKGNGKFILDTDASDFGIGGVLSQLQDGKEVVLAYGSRTMTSEELNYCVTRKELLAVVHHIQLFEPYLIGQQFEVRTDHASLKYLHRFKAQNGQLARWLDFLQQFDFQIVTRPGTSHGNADGLSRIDHNCGGKKCYCQQFADLEYEPPIIMETKKYVDVSVQTQCSESSIKQAQASSIDKGKVQEVSDTPIVRAVSIFPYWTIEDMKKDQLSDPDIGPVLQFLQKGESKPIWKDVSHLSANSKLLLNEWERLELKNDLLYRKWTQKDGKTFWFQLVLPFTHRKTALEQIHDSVSCGHTGINKTLNKMRARFFFPGMSSYVERWVKTCTACQQRKGPRPKAKNPMQAYTVGVPCERVASDIMGPFSESDQGNKWIMIITDYFRKYAVPIPLPDITADTIAEAFVSN